MHTFIQVFSSNIRSYSWIMFLFCFGFRFGLVWVFFCNRCILERKGNSLKINYLVQEELSSDTEKSANILRKTERALVSQINYFYRPVKIKLWGFQPSDMWHRAVLVQYVAQKIKGKKGILTYFWINIQFVYVF